MDKTCSSEVSTAMCLLRRVARMGVTALRRLGTGRVLADSGKVLACLRISDLMASQNSTAFSNGSLHVEEHCCCAWPRP